MEITGWVSAIFVGLVIGVLGRLMVRNREPAGCIITVITGIVGAALGGWLVTSIAGQNVNFLLVLLVQIVIAAIITAIISRPRAGSPPSSQ